MRAINRNVRINIEQRWNFSPGILQLCVYSLVILCLSIHERSGSLHNQFCAYLIIFASTLSLPVEHEQTKYFLLTTEPTNVSKCEIRDLHFASFSEFIQLGNFNEA